MDLMRGTPEYFDSLQEGFPSGIAAQSMSGGPSRPSSMSPPPSSSAEVMSLRGGNNSEPVWREKLYHSTSSRCASITPFLHYVSGRLMFRTENVSLSAREDGRALYPATSGVYVRYSDGVVLEKTPMLADVIAQSAAPPSTSMGSVWLICAIQG